MNINGERRDYFAILEEQVRTKIQELQRDSDILANRAECLEAIIDDLNQGILALNPDGNIILMNRRAQEHLGISFEECVGLPVDKSAIDPAFAKEIIQCAYEAGRNHTHVCSNSGLKLSINSSRIISAKGEVLGTVLRFTDCADSPADLCSSAFPRSLPNEY